MRRVFLVMGVLAVFGGWQLELPRLVPRVATAGSPVLIANKGVTVSALSKREVQEIALGDKTTWSGGESIIFVTLESGDTHTQFLRMYAGKTPAQFNNFWMQAVFTGKGKPPRTFPTEEALLRYVESTRGAIGYVSAGTDVSAVKTIQVED